MTPSVRELQIDFLLQEEFSSSLAFLKAFTKLAGRVGTPVEMTLVQRSRSDAFGEADLTVIYRDSNEALTAILIEDKIKALFQPRQAERYRLRGETGTEWTSFWTCLVAPESYAKRQHAFDHVVTLEALISLFAPNESARNRFKASVIEAAIKKANTTGVQVVDPGMTEFRKRYFSAFEEFFRSNPYQVSTRPPMDTYAGDAWWMFKSSFLPKGVYVRYKAPFGAVDLTFPDLRRESLALFQLPLSNEMSLVQTGKSAAIRVKVPKILAFDDFDREENKVRASLEAVSFLIAFAELNHRQIESALQSVRASVA